MSLDTCPDRDSLEQLLLGRIATAEAERLEEHLLQCDTCSAIADTVTASDELTEAIRKRHVIEGDEEILAQVIERGKQLRCEAETLQSELTVIADRNDESRADKPEFDPEDIDFLAPPEQPDEIGRLGGYRVLEILGVGGMGVVFRAEDPKLERKVALKAMKPTIAASKSAKERFLNEAKAAAAIEHDHIVTIYQVSEDGGIPFIAMRYLRGESLQTRLEREKQLDQQEVLRLGRQIAAGLAAAHERELIHRDIKPDNIWLDSKQDRVKIVDFGLVRSTTDDSGLTQSNMVVGTPKYMSPEQAGGEMVDHRCDLFSLGSVLYHLLAGQPPFTGANLTATLMAVAQANPTPIESVCSDLHPDLIKLVGRLLSKDCDQRPQSAEEVAETIAEIEKQLAEEEAERVRQRHLAETAVLPTSPVPAVGGKSRSPLFLGGVVATLALGVVAALWASGIIFKAETPDGTLVIKVVGDDFTTSVKGKKITIENTTTNEKHTIDLSSPELTKKLSPGDYRFLLTTASGLETRTDRFTITSGKNANVEVWWERKAKQVSISQTNFALSFDGEESYVETPVKYDGTHPITIEAKVRSPGSANSSIAAPSANSNSGFTISRVDNLWGMSFRTKNAGWKRTASQAFVHDDRRVYLAAVIDRKSLRFYVDGQLVNSHEMAETPLRPSADSIVLGSSSVYPLHGIIDEVRVSNVARYTKDFTPAKRFTADKHTLALYHFDSGSGTVLKDSSGNGHHGKIVGAKWVRVDDQLKVIGGARPPIAKAPFNAEEAKQHQVAWANYLGVPVEHTNEIGMTFRLVPPGEFLMGASKKEYEIQVERMERFEPNYRDFRLNELKHALPQHQVRIRSAFYLATTETTVGQFRRFVEQTRKKTYAETSGGGWALGKKGYRRNEELYWNVPGHSQTDEFPVVHVTWHEAVDFCEWLGELDGGEYLLPTEAQWEFAARAGALAGGFKNDAIGQMHAVCATSQPEKVASRLPSPFGIYDMLGNVDELCRDAYRPDFYKISPTNDPHNTSSATVGIATRGGTCSALPGELLSWTRHRLPDKHPSIGTGFRATLSVVTVRKDVASRENYALELDGKSSYVETPVNYDGSYPITVEALVNAKPPFAESGTLIADAIAGAGLSVNCRSELRGWQFAHYSVQEWKANHQPSSVDTRHVAAVLDGATLRLYLDGRSVGKGVKSARHRGSTEPFMIGAARTMQDAIEHFFHGIIDEVRISNVARYTKDFTPAKRFTTDKHTLALYHFDEGSGTVLKDSSGNGHHGKIVGAKWVQVDDELKVLDYVWPKNQPAPAIAPFTAEQAKKHQEAWAKHLGVPVETTNSIGMKFRLIPPGEFLMGSSEEEIQRLADEFKLLKLPAQPFRWLHMESPRHRVVLTYPILVGVHEVTNGQFRRFVDATGYKTDAQRDGKGGFNFEGEQSPEFLWNTDLGLEQTAGHPVVNISWNDAQAFCKWLSESDKHKYSLPTEAQWEFVCRAGTTSRFNIGNDASLLPKVAWYKNDGGMSTKTVGQKQPNAFGCFDMHGNAYEWCRDGLRPYSIEVAIDPLGAQDKWGFALRGAAFGHAHRSLRSAQRYAYQPDERYMNTGFRIVREIKIKSITTAAPDRAAAEWVLGIGGKVMTDVDKLETRTVDELPKESFKVVSIVLNGNKEVKDNDLEVLAGLMKLEWLDLAGTVGDVGLEHLKSVTTLRHLDLNKTKVSDVGLKHIKGLTKLKTLALAYSEVTDAGLHNFSGMANLTILNLTGTKVTRQGIAKLKKALPNCKITWGGNIDPDRKAAEWLLGIGGRSVTVKVDGGERSRSKVLMSCRRRAFTFSRQISFTLTRRTKN